MPLVYKITINQSLNTCKNLDKKYVVSFTVYTSRKLLVKFNLKFEIFFMNVSCMVCVYVIVCEYVYVYMPLCVYICELVSLCICEYVCVYVCVMLYVCVYVCVCHGFCLCVS